MAFRSFNASMKVDGCRPSRPIRGPEVCLESASGLDRDQMLEGAIIGDQNAGGVQSAAPSWACQQLPNVFRILLREQDADREL